MRSEKVMGALEKIQSDVIVAQSAISAVQMLAEKIPGGQIVSKGLEKMNLMLGVANVGISFAEAGIEFSSHQNKQAEQFLLYGALDIFGNMVTISDVNEYSTNSFIRNVLTKGKTIGTYTEYLMAGQSEVLAYNDFKSGNMTSAIEITAANVLNIGLQDERPLEVMNIPRRWNHQTPILNHMKISLPKCQTNISLPKTRIPKCPMRIPKCRMKIGTCNKVHFSPNHLSQTGSKISRYPNPSKN
ncbi:MAG: hypothetical protein EBV19_05145 [Flavobacteriia bacterium]|nr:hypothetical protein [Flavobacteriia bacterium]